MATSPTQLTLIVTTHISPNRTHLYRTAVLTASIVLAAVFLEVAIRCLVHGGVLNVPAPPPVRSTLWDPAHSEFGVWHHAHANEVHTRQEFSVVYRTNSIGARDVERKRASDHSRVVVLGDSFIEGWGVSEDHRLTNLLETSTGVEHLNFGMSHFGPYQSLLVYRNLAKKYSHDGLIVGVLPLNDFWDLDYKAAQTALRYEYRFRPYLIGDYPQYERFDYREPILSRFFRRRFYTFNAFNMLCRKLSSQKRPDLDQIAVNSGKRFPSYYYDLGEEHFHLLSYCIERMVEEAAGKRVAVVLIPVLNDFMRFHQTKERPLMENLQALAASHPSLRIVDLLPAMYQQTENRKFKSYFRIHDYHWNEYGNKIAAHIVKQELAGFIYNPKEPATQSPSQHGGNGCPPCQ